jgi:hypothetical protein
MMASSSQAEKKKETLKKNVEKGGNLPLFSHFYIWDEAFFLPSPLHVPSMMNFPPSSSLVSHVSSKFCAIQVQELS